MLRKLLIASALSSALLVSACATNPDGTTSINIPGPTDPRVIQVQEAAKNICGFLPVASTVAGILASFVGGSGVVDIATQAAQGICSAVTSKGARRGLTPKYRGVAIHGEFVRR